MTWTLPPWVVPILLALVLVTLPACPTTAQDGPGRPIPYQAAHPVSPMPSPSPGPSYSVTGVATWYAWRSGEAAAGGPLRDALGPDWRGRLVTVTGPTGAVVVVRLTDWCACPGGRIIDLDRRAFATLADPALGVLKVVATWDR